MKPKKPSNPESYFWHTLGKHDTYVELIADGRLNFAFIEVSVKRLGKDKAGVFLDMIGRIPDNIWDAIHLHLDADRNGKVIYIILARNERLIDEAKEVLKLEDPEQFIDRLRQLETRG